jgi:methionyl-tRNA synthetase
MAPITPASAASIRTQLGVPPAGDVWEIDPALAGREVGTPSTIFAKIEPELVAELAERFRGKHEVKAYPPLTYAVDPSIDYPSYLLEFSNVTVKRRSAELDRQRRSALEGLDLAALRARPTLRSYEELLRERDRGGRGVSVTNLIDIVERTGKLPTINVLVDAYNLESLLHGVVMGAYDRRALKGGLRMKVADGAEHFVPVAGSDPETILPGEWVIVDAEDRVVTKIVTKQSEAVAVTTRTTHAALCIQGTPLMPREDLKRVAVETCELIQRLCGGTWRIVNE